MGRFADGACLILAALWGFAEATLFFVVPDVVISAAAMWSRRLALWCAVLATGTAVIGGAVMHGWGRVDPEAALRALDAVPTVGRPMIDGVEQRLRRRGLSDMFAGAVAGKPYKIYAVQTGRMGVPLTTFIAVSIPARAVRFFAVALVVDAINRWLCRSRWSTRARHGLLVGIWVVIYAVSFATHGW